MAAPKKTTATKTAAAKTPELEKATEVTEESAVEAEPTPTEEPAGAEGNGDPAAPENDAAAADAAGGTDPEESGEGDPEDEDGEEGEEGEQPLDSAQLAAIATSADKAQMASQEQANAYAESQYSEPEKLSHAKAEVAKRDREAMDAELTAGRTTPAHVIAQVGADGKKTGSNADGTLAPIDRSGLHGPSQADLNPAFAIAVD